MLSGKNLEEEKVNPIELMQYAQHNQANVHQTQVSQLPDVSDSSQRMGGTKLNYTLTNDNGLDSNILTQGHATPEMSNTFLRISSNGSNSKSKRLRNDHHSQSPKEGSPLQRKMKVIQQQTRLVGSTYEANRLPPNL